MLPSQKAMMTRSALVVCSCQPGSPTVQMTQTQMRNDSRSTTGPSPRGNSTVPPPLDSIQLFGSLGIIACLLSARRKAQCVSVMISAPALSVRDSLHSSCWRCDDHTGESTGHWDEGLTFYRDTPRPASDAQYRPVDRA